MSFPIWLGFHFSEEADEYEWDWDDTLFDYSKFGLNHQVLYPDDMLASQYQYYGFVNASFLQAVLNILGTLTTSSTLNFVFNSTRDTTVKMNYLCSKQDYRRD